MIKDTISINSVENAVFIFNNKDIKSTTSNKINADKKDSDNPTTNH